MQRIVGRAWASGCHSNVIVGHCVIDKLLFLAKQMSSVHEKEQDNLVPIFVVIRLSHLAQTACLSSTLPGNHLQDPGLSCSMEPLHKITTITCHCRRPCGYMATTSPRHNASLQVFQSVPGLEVPWRAGWSCWQVRQADTGGFTTGPPGFLKQIQERLGVWRKMFWNVLVYPNRHWDKDLVYEIGPGWSRKLTDHNVCVVPLQNTPSWQVSNYSASSHNLKGWSDQ